MRFEELGIIAPILKAVQEKGYTEPSPIQEQAIPNILKNKDVLACAQTGTGKTAAFAIPVIQIIQEMEGTSNEKGKLRSLILTPTRELAIQIDDNIKAYSKNTDVKHAVIFGGVKQGKQVDQLRRGVHILVATPGRLLDLINQRIISLDTIKIFVLDEADRMLDMGFIHDMRKVIKLLPQKRQTLFFSATMPNDIVNLSSTILNNPIKIEISPASTTAETVEQYLYYTNRTSKKDLLVHIIEKEKMDQVLVFSRTKRGADRIAKDLKKRGVKAAAIHGDKVQNQRQKTLSQFKDGKLTVLVATDIAARGIDIQKLKFVINYEISNIPETYVHRIGRSGRAGENGVAISLAEPEENAFVRDIERLIKQKITVISDHPFPQTDKPMTEAEKKEWNAEKQRKKQEFFENRRNKSSKKNEKKKDKPKSERRSNDRKPFDKSKREMKEDKNSMDRKPTDRKKSDQKQSDRRKDSKAKSNQNPESNHNSNKDQKSFKKDSKTDSKGRKKLTPNLQKKLMWPLD